MTKKIDRFMLEKLKENIVLKDVKHRGNYFSDFQNCYTYALNIDLPIWLNIGDISDNYNPDYGFDDFDLPDINDEEIPEHLLGEEVIKI